MIIYVKYDEDVEVADVIYIPDTPVIEIEQKQNEFFKWLFDKSNDHSYWRTVDGRKTYCAYDVQAFIEWLNEKIYKDYNVEAKLLQKDSNEIISDVPILYF